MPQIKYKSFLPEICKETEKGINNLRWVKKPVQYNAMLNIKNNVKNKFSESFAELNYCLHGLTVSGYQAAPEWMHITERNLVTVTYDTKDKSCGTYAVKKSLLEWLFNIASETK